jgi:hypothetical protein
LTGTVRHSTGIALLLCTLLSGCATVSRPTPIPPEQCWTDQEQLGERTRFYAHVAADQALGVAGRLLRLAGQDDMKFSHAANSISAEFHRERLFYLLWVAHNASVWDHWVVAARPAPGGVNLCVHVRGQYFTDTFVLGAEPVSNVVYPASAIERDPGKRFKPPARAHAVDFDTFWDRLEYLLGLTPGWASCPPGESGGVRRNAALGRVEMNPLCHPLVDDPGPPAVNDGRFAAHGLK